MKTLRALLVAFLGICLVGVGAVVALGATGALPGFRLFGASAETRNTQIVTAVTREEQVVLLSLGIQGIEVKDQGPTEFFGIKIPGSERAAFLEYGFNAKVGIDGRHVHVQQTAEKEYLVSIPEFSFLGHSDEHFRVAAVENGVLSFISAPIDPVEMINGILNEASQRKYVDSNTELLKDQSKAFYTGIISAIDPTISLNFEFTS
jgi:hypothetical protein